jgi:hypothetical protein
MFWVPEGETKFFYITFQGNDIRHLLSKPQSLWSLNHTVKGKGKVPHWGTSALQPKAYCALTPKEFLHSSLEALHTAAPQLCEGNFATNPVKYVDWWVLLHAAKLGHGADSFTSPPKEGMLRIFNTR